MGCVTLVSLANESNWGVGGRLERLTVNRPFGATTTKRVCSSVLTHETKRRSCEKKRKHHNETKVQSHNN